MTERHRFILALVCGTGIAAAIVLTKEHHQPNSPASPQSPAPTAANQASGMDSKIDVPQVPHSPALALSGPTLSSPPLVRSIKPIPANADTNPNPKPRKKSNGSGTPNPSPVLAAPQARIALAFVGTDADAETVWNTAINDPLVPPNERKDLIEDLNEDGFADPHHISPQEMPLVLSRIQLIEQMAPFAMDDTNAAAFNEAYKDLTNMLTDPNPK
jgi:hypothetical protein